MRDRSVVQEPQLFGGSPSLGLTIANGLIQPHGGVLSELMAGPQRRAELQRASRTWPSVDLSERQLCDLELLLTGGFSPLRGFMCRNDYESVCASMRLSSGLLWPIPVTLDVPPAFANRLGPGASVALRDPEGVMLAALHVQELWRTDPLAEAQAVFGSTDPAHPGVQSLMRSAGNTTIGGTLEGVQLPAHYDYRALRLTPAELRAEFASQGWTRVVAFQTRNPMHRAHLELTLRAARETGANLLLHPVVGMTRPGDIDHYTRVRCYQAILRSYPAATARLALLPLAMRMAGPREAVWHAIIRKNHGCTHFIVGRDHAGPGADGNGRAYYDPYAAQDLLRQHEAELDIRMVPFRAMTYLPDAEAYAPEDEIPPGTRTLSLSGTELRKRLARGQPIPEWFTFREVAEELQRTHPPRSRQGFTVFLTGLSGSGKSTIANVLLVKLLEVGGRAVTMLDGDLVRKHLSSELGFTKDHRDLNIRRIGFVASEITKHGGIAICAPIAPYDCVRREVREMIEAVGGFVLVYLSTPLDTCERRDRKGLYAKARAGLIEQFTGISDPYEAPSDAEIECDTTAMTPEEAADRVLHHLRAEGYLEA